MTCTRCHDKRAVEEKFEPYARVREGAHSRRDSEVDAAIEKHGVERLHKSGREGKSDARMASREAIDDRGNEARGKRRDGANANFSTYGIGEKLDLVYCLAQIVEHRRPALEQGATVGGRLDTPRGAVEQGHSKRRLQVGNGPRNGRLCDIELRSRLAHTARLNDGYEDSQIL